jgi:hypothetical protein
MNRDDIIRMAREAGFTELEFYGSKAGTNPTECLERFAALVAAAVYENEDMFAEAYAGGYSAGAVAESEACAKVVESDPSYDWHPFACEAAAAIRARGKE